MWSLNDDLTIYDIRLVFNYVSTQFFYHLLKYVSVMNRVFIHIVILIVLPDSYIAPVSGMGSAELYQYTKKISY